MLPSTLARQARARAFTLVELIVVILTLGVLAAVGVVGYTQVTGKGEAAAAQTNLRQIATAVLAHHTAEQLPAMTRDSFLAALEEVSVDVTDGLGADGWTFYGVGAAPDAAGEYAVGFDTGQGTPASDTGGTRAVVVTATSTGQAFARIIWWPMGTTTGVGPGDSGDGSGPGDGGGAVPPGTTPSDVLSDPSVITPPGGSGPGSGGGPVSACPSELTFSAEVDYAFDQPHWGIWLHTTIPDPAFDWSRITVTETHYPAGSDTPQSVEPVYASPTQWIDWVSWAPDPTAGPDDLHMLTLYVDDTRCAQVGGNVPEVPGWATAGGWTAPPVFNTAWESCGDPRFWGNGCAGGWVGTQTQGLLVLSAPANAAQPGGTVSVALANTMTNPLGSPMRGRAYLSTSTTGNPAVTAGLYCERWNSYVRKRQVEWCGDLSAPIRPDGMVGPGVSYPSNVATVTVAPTFNGQPQYIDHIALTAGAAPLAKWYPPGHPLG